MVNPRKAIFDAVRAAAPAGLFNDTGNVLALNNLLDAFGVELESLLPARELTMRIMLELLEHEGIVCEAYKDSKGIWTWGVGVTNMSGHKVARYKDAPVSVERVLEVYEWLLRTKYLPEVLEAFGSTPLTEEQLGAALSFHWNTGAIKTATWVKTFKAGDLRKAREQIMDWTKDKELTPRRMAERNLFFDGVWASDGIIMVWPVSKPSYKPAFGKGVATDIRKILEKVVAAAAS